MNDHGAPQSLLATSSPKPAAKQAHRVDWRSELVVLMLAAAETAVLWLMIDLVARVSQSHALPGWSLFLLVSVASLLPRWLEEAGVWDRSYSVATVLAVVATTLVAIKTASFPATPWLDSGWLRDAALAIGWWPVDDRMPVWAVILIAAYAWWRGKTRAEPGPDAALTMFRLGTAIMLVVAGAHAMAAGEGSARAASLAVFVFFCSALSAIALARLRPEGERGRHALGARWLGPQLLPVMTVALTAAGGAAALSPAMLDTMLWLLAPLVWALAVVFRFVVVVLAVIAFVLVFPFLWLLSRHPIQVGGVRWTVPASDPRAWISDATASAADLPGAVRVLVAVGVLMALFSGVTRLVLRTRRPVAVKKEDRASVLGARELAALTMAWLRRIRHRRARPADPLAALRNDPRWRHTVAVREIYAAFLRWCAARDHARPASWTPSEHSAYLLAHLPKTGFESDIVMLTETYNGVRYGDTPATAADSARAREAWAHIRRIG